MLDGCSAVTRNWTARMIPMASGHFVELQYLFLWHFLTSYILNRIAFLCSPTLHAVVGVLLFLFYQWQRVCFIQLPFETPLSFASMRIQFGTSHFIMIIRKSSLLSLGKYPEQISILIGHTEKYVSTPFLNDDVDFVYHQIIVMPCI